jgi:hypothetical protein
MVAVKERQTCCVLFFTDISVQLKFCHGRFLGDTNDCEMSQKLRFISKGDCQGTALLTMDPCFVTTWRPKSLALCSELETEQSQFRTSESSKKQGQRNLKWSMGQLLLCCWHTHEHVISLHSQPGLARATGTVEFRTAALARVSRS